MRGAASAALRLVGLLGPGSPRSRSLRLGLALVVLLGVAAAGRALLGRGLEPGKGDPATVRRDDLVVTVEIEGELAAVRAIEIGAPPIRDLWDYKIASLAPESARVKKGDPLIGFDTQPLMKSLEEKTAEHAEAVKQIERRGIDLSMQLGGIELQLADAEVRLTKARLKTDVPEELKGRIEALQAEIELRNTVKEVENLRAKLRATRVAGQADLRALRSGRDRALARVEELRAAIETMQVRAPQDGIVIYKTGWRDEKKKVGDSTWVGEKVLELPDLSEMRADAQVDEADAGQVRVGQTATIRLEARPDLDFAGRVQSIGQTVQRKSWRVPTKIYKIVIALDRTDPEVMRPAMRFRGEIETERLPALILAPLDAIFLRSYGPVAWLKRGSGYREVPVELGRKNKSFVEILSGLEEGDSIARFDLRPPGRARPRGPMEAGL